MRLRHMNNIARRTLLLVLAVLATASYAASPEYLVGGTAPAPAPLLRHFPATASDGEDFFVVWSDSRSGTPAVMATRVKRTGQILDPLGIRIAGATGLVIAPQVVWDGGAYLVVWATAEWTGSGYWGQPAVHAARVDRDGRMVMAPRVIAENASTTEGRYAASNGNVSVIAYLDGERGPRNPARLVVLDRDGNTLRHEALASTSAYRSGFTIAAGPSQFVVAWEANPGFDPNGTVIEAVKVTADGHVSGSPVTLGAGQDAAIATDGTRYTVVWRRWLQSEYVWILMSRTIDADLTPFTDVQPVASGEIEYVSMRWRGDRYEIIAGGRIPPATDYHIISIELDRDGKKLGSRNRGALDVLYPGPQIVAATNGTDLFVALTSTSPFVANQQIVGRLYRGNSTAADAPLLLSWSGNAHGNPQIASSASGQFVAWNEDDGVYATRIDPQGNALDGRGIRISTRTGSVRTAFDGTNYVVAWIDSDFIGVRYVAPSTGAIVAEAHVPAIGWEGLALAASPQAMYVVFVEEERIRVTRIPHATHTPDPAPLVVSPEGMLAAAPAAAWNGSALLVTWSEQYWVPRGDPPLVLSIGIHAARVTEGLTLLDPAPMVVAKMDQPMWPSFGPSSVASNGQDWLVVADLHGEDILARRVLRNGTVDGNAPVKIGAGGGAVVAWDGVRYAVAWKEGDLRQRERPLVLAAVPSTGALVATRRTIVATRTAPSMPSIARTAAGHAAVVYTRLSFLPEHTGVERTFLRVFDLGIQRGRGVRR